MIKMPKIRTYILLLPLLIFYSCGAKRQAANVTPSAVTIGGVPGAYIERYSDLAIRQMQRSGVPASIILAQGMLESNYGRSRLAVVANNHFGIKCHSGWQGETTYHNDDRANECFRKYRSVEDSFYDHSNFLSTNPRYRDLFKLKPDDYRGWARGLRQAGYATDPDYANKLIRIIETNELWRFDRGQSASVNRSRNATPATPAPARATNNRARTTTAAVSPESSGFAVPERVSRVSENNRIRYIVVNERDTRESIERDFNLLRWELSRYNELDNNFNLHPGQILYLQPKRNRAEVGKETHTVVNGDSMYSISQQYGIKLKKLYEMNRMREGEEPKVGDRVWLRSKKPVR
jgi:LysM repeat protein